MAINRNSWQGKLGLATVSLVAIFVLAPAGLSQAHESTSVLLYDNFTKDTQRKPTLWATNTAFLDNLAAVAWGSTYVTPTLTLSRKAGMQMTFPANWYTMTGVQSVSAFSPPFTVNAVAEPVAGISNPFAVYLFSADFAQYVDVECNMGAYYGCWVNAQDISEIFFASPQYDTVYAVQIMVNDKGAATAKIGSGGKALATVKGLEVGGTGPFYLVLGQRIGLPPRLTTQVGNWFSAKVSTPLN